MSALDIRPHSRRLSRNAVLALALVAGGSFALNLARQLAPPGPSPFSAPQGMAVAVQVPEATPAPAMQVATSEPPPRRHAEEAAPETPPEAADAAAPELLAVPAAASPDALPAADTSATAPDPAPPPEPPPPEEPPA
jgi:hypothetical protein